MGKNRAISIGINKYEFLQPLKYAQRDAQLMQEFLVKEAGFEQVLFFSDDSPHYRGKLTRPFFVNLKKVLRTMFEKPSMADGDNFWFFFSGHGMPHNGLDYLMACDSDPGDVEHTAISINYLTERLRRCGADNVILILDACRNQGSKSGEGIGNQAAEVARQKGVITFFSCRPNELSYEIDALQQGAFTKALLEGLGFQRQCATVEKLNNYLIWRVPELLRQHKSDKLQQTPYTVAEPIEKSLQILLPEYVKLADTDFPISFSSSDNSSKLDYDFIWQGNNLVDNGYELHSTQILKIFTIGHTDQSKSEDSAPLVAYPIEGDFEAEVKINFQSNIHYQRAGFGIRSLTDRYTYLRIQMLEYQRVEVSLNQSKQGSVLYHVVYESNIVYFKIKRLRDNIDFFYAFNNKSEWIKAKSIFYSEIAGKAELFFNVLSAHNSSKASGEFSNFKVKYF